MIIKKFNEAIDADEIRNIFSDFLDEYGMHEGFQVIENFEKRSIINRYVISFGNVYTISARTFNSLVNGEHFLVVMSAPLIIRNGLSAPSNEYINKYINNEKSEELISEIKDRMEEIGYTISTTIERYIITEPSYGYLISRRDIKLIGMRPNLELAFKFTKKYKTINESVDIEDIKNIFQDIEDDFPDLNFNFSEMFFRRLSKEIKIGEPGWYDNEFTHSDRYRNYSWRGAPVIGKSGKILDEIEKKRYQKKIKFHYQEIKDRLLELNIKIHFIFYKVSGQKDFGNRKYQILICLFDNKSTNIMSGCRPPQASMNESMDKEDFNLIFQDIKDDFPEIKWIIHDENIENILDKDSKDRIIGMCLGHNNTWNKNLIGISRRIPFIGGPNPQRFSDGVTTYYPDVRKMSEKLKPYFDQIKNRLLDHGIKIKFTISKEKNQWKELEWFKYAIFLDNK